ncbi:MAG: tyrosine recombinase XerC [Burkholderiales bacterium]|nr:tyrosine recombinase XerC [Burkholderiales bacterium]
MPRSSATASTLARPAPSEAGLARLTAFLEHLAHERRLSVLTVEHYGRDVRDLLALIDGRPLESLNVHDLRRCLSRLHAGGLSGRSLARKLSAWRTFFTWLVRDHGLPSNPAIGLRAPKAPKRLPSSLTPDESAQLLDGPADDDMALRDRAIFELIYSSGLRLAEVAGLDPMDVDLVDGSVRVTGKGSKTRVLPIGRQAIAALQAWLPLRNRLAKPGETALFVGDRGARIAHRVIQTRLKSLAQQRGLTANVHPHVLRHSFASHLLQSSGDLRAVQELLGHASISTTQIYTHLDFQHLAKVYDAAHPRAKKK